MISTPGLPSYLQQNPASASQSYLSQLPGMFNTSGLQSAYGNQEQSNWDSGSALAAAAANQYVQRAQQSGASTLGAGFAQASAMLPVYQQNASMQSDLQNKMLQYKAQQATIGAGLSGDIGRLQGQYQGTLSDYFLNQQKLQQQQQQFGDTFGLQQRQLSASVANQNAQNSLQGASLALKYAPSGAGNSYETGVLGQPSSPQDAATMARVNQQQTYLRSVLGGLPGGGGGSGYAGTAGYGSVTGRTGTPSPDAQWGNMWGLGY